MDEPSLPPMPPVPPESTPEHPLSQVAPGDDLRELIHEIRNARAAIEAAEGVFAKRSEMVANYQATRRAANRRFWALLAVIIVAVAALVIVGQAAADAYSSQQRSLRHLQYDNCEQRNAANANGQRFFEQYIAILSASQDQQTARKVIALLHDFNATSISQPDCSKLLR